MIVDLNNLIPIKTVPKVWGKELWLINNEDYCAKILEVNPGFRCSLHYHPIKHETFIVLRGTVILDFLPSAYPEHYFNSGRMIPGDIRDIKPLDRHRFGVVKDAPVPGIILEISTHHDDNDVVRIEESGLMP